MIPNFHQFIASIPDYMEGPEPGDLRLDYMNDDEIWAWAARAEANNALREKMLAELRAGLPEPKYDWIDLPNNPAYDDDR